MNPAATLSRTAVLGHAKKAPPTPTPLANEENRSDDAADSFDAMFGASAIRCSAFTSPDGAKPVGKRVFLDERGNYASETLGDFDRLQCEAKTFASLREVHAFIAGADSSQHLTAGICAHPKTWVVPKGTPTREGKGTELPIVNRDKDTFPFPKGHALMFVDSDSLELMSLTPSAALAKAVPALEDYACIETSSSSANIFGPDGKALRGLTGMHTIYHVADGSDIPRALDVLHARLFIGGFGLPRLSSTGAFLERSPCDRAMKTPCQPLYLRARCESGLRQKKSARLYDGTEVLDTRTVLPDLTAAEEQAYAAAVKALRTSLLGDSQKARKAWLAARVKAMVASGVAQVEAEEAAEAALAAKPRLLPDWTIVTSDGEEVTVEQILSEGRDIWHLRTVRDPLEPEYGSRTVAKVFFNEDSVAINSQAHGGRSFTLQRTRATAAEDFANAALGGDIDLAHEELGAHIAQLTQAVNQDANAHAFALKYGERLRYAGDVGKWFGYLDGCWQPDVLGKVQHLIRLMCRSIPGAKAKQRNHHTAIETMCRHDPAFAVTAAQTFDRDNYLLNTPQGAIDLRTGTMLAHSPDLLCSKMTRVAPSVDGGERFRHFLDEITLGDPELIEFLQVSLGACLSGAIESHWLLFWIGTGRNGKNTLGDLVMWIMGDYAKKIPATTLMAKEHEGHPTEVASLMGCRLAVASEIEQGAFWQEAKINELTGDGSISARFMRQDFFEFERTHKHLVFGNNRPRLKTVTDALKARIKIVPFKASFVGREDAELPAKLRAEAGFVLSWLIDGHRKWLASGRKLPKCAAVDAESANYFDSQAVVEMWMSERLIITPDDGRAGRGWPQAKTLYDDYARWKLDRGEKPLSMTIWGEAMTKRFDHVLAGGKRYRGCCLNPTRFGSGFDKDVAEYEAANLA